MGVPVNRLGAEKDLKVAEHVRDDEQAESQAGDGHEKLLAQRRPNEKRQTAHWMVVVKQTAREYQKFFYVLPISGLGIQNNTV